MQVTTINSIPAWVIADYLTNIAQKVKFLIKDFFSKCDQIRRKLITVSYLLNPRDTTSKC